MPDELTQKKLDLAGAAIRSGAAWHALDGTLRLVDAAIMKGDYAAAAQLQDRCTELLREHMDARADAMQGAAQFGKAAT